MPRFTSPISYYDSSDTSESNRSSRIMHHGSDLHGGFCALFNESVNNGSYSFQPEVGPRQTVSNLTCALAAIPETHRLLLYVPLTMASTIRLTSRLLILIISTTYTLALFSNCKCQDENGQYNMPTAVCCAKEAIERYSGLNDVRYPGPDGQCASLSASIQFTGYNLCCTHFWGPHSHQIGGAFCW
jgi:hypothetical protein